MTIRFPYSSNKSQFMSGNGEAASNAMHTVDDDADASYHVRLIQRWLPLQTSPPLDKPLASSFYGLQLELRGTAQPQSDSCTTSKSNGDAQITTESTLSPSQVATVPLLFSIDTPPSSAVLAPLEAVTGPFTVVVRNKLTIQAIDEQAAVALQQITSVQVDNTLLEVNGERFLIDANATGADIYRRLWFVATRASLATPYELTFRRHNLAQASAKIVPFARRRDVQDAQIAQLAKLAAQEAALPLAVRRKKLFLVQQLDFEREHYLVAYVCAELQELHTQVMSGGQWQAYEFGKALWYFHAPSSRLYAQHPLRSHPKARQLITGVQDQVQQAVRRLQRRTRSRQRRKRLLCLVQEQIKRREEEKRREEQQIQQAARRVQGRFRAHQRRKRLLATTQAAKRRQEELRREQQRAEELRREQLRLEELHREAARAEEKRQIEMLKQERRRLQLELDETKLELQKLRRQKETRAAVQSETQTSGRRDENNAIEQLRKQEQQRVQQRLEHLELELQRMRDVTSAIESQTQTSSRYGETTENNSARQKFAEQQRAQQRIEELELKLRHQSTTMTAESVTQTSARRGTNVRDEGVDTGEDLEWQRYLTLLRVAVNKKMKTSPKTRHTQTDTFDHEESFISSMLRPAQKAASYASISRKLTSEWKGFPSWQRDSISNNSSNSSLLSLKGSTDQLDDMDAESPPARMFESFFASDATSQQPPPTLVELPWRQDSTFLPLKSSRKVLEITPLQPPPTLQLREYEEPIRPIRVTGNTFPSTQSSPVLRSTKLPYITLRRKKVMGSP